MVCTSAWSGQANKASKRAGCVGEDVSAGQECFTGRVQGVAFAAAMSQGFLLDALAALLSGVDSDMNDGACLIVCVSVFCLKGLMHDE